MAQLVTAVWIATKVHPSETISADAFVKAAVIGIAGMVGPVAVAAALSGLVASGQVVPRLEASNVASQEGEASPPVLERRPSDAGHDGDEEPQEVHDAATADTDAAENAAMADGAAAEPGPAHPHAVNSSPGPQGTVMRKGSEIDEEDVGLAFSTPLAPSLEMDHFAEVTKEGDGDAVATEETEGTKGKR